MAPGKQKTIRSTLERLTNPDREIRAWLDPAQRAVGHASAAHPTNPFELGLSSQYRFSGALELLSQPDCTNSRTRVPAILRLRPLDRSPSRR